METNLEIVPFIDKENGLLQIKDYGNLKTKVDSFVKDNSLFLKPTDEQELKLCKKEREDINRALKNVSRLRIDLVNLYVGDFEKKIKDLEKALEKASNEHKEVLDLFKAPKAPEPPKEASNADSNGNCRVIFEGTPEIISQIKFYAQKLGAKLVE